MRLLMVAPPGAGKGTQATRLASYYGIAHLSSGDVLRNEVASESPLGQDVADYLARGDLVPDELLLELLAGPVIQAAADGGYVLDGFPRSRGQAEEAYKIAQEVSGVELQAVIHMEVERDELRRRLLARAAKEGRSDDNEITIANRLKVYDSETLPMLAFYAERGLIVDIDGNQSVDEVFQDIVQAVDGVRADLR